MNSDQKRAALTMVLCVLIFVGWNYFFPAPQPLVTDNSQTTRNIQITTAQEESASDITSAQKPMVEQSVELSNSEYSYSLNQNLSITQMKSTTFKKTLSEVYDLQKNNLLVLKGQEYQPITVSFYNKTQTSVSFKNDSGITGMVTLLASGMLDFKVVSTEAFKYRFRLYQSQKELTGGKLKQFVWFDDELDYVSVGSDDDGDSQIKWFGMDYDYYLFAFIIDGSPKIFKVTESGIMTVSQNTPVTTLDYKSLFVRKEYDRLTQLGSNLNLSVDFGFFGILAAPILKALQYFYGLIPNYGIAIIIVTILMRLLTFPLQYKSYKSMKKMQEVQPELTKLKEKYKDDPKQMQMETMALFKRAGANPIGGCLPMILQMPIFFAFYRVLYNAVELVDAPFYGWIQDLSEKDPYYVLPVLMALAMFFHQKLTPTATVDPTQKKIMMFMPIIFAFIMKDFPSGLTLYICVSTIVAMLQQILVYRKS